MLHNIIKGHNMLKGHIHLSKTSSPIETKSIKCFSVIQNNNHCTVYEVDFERNGSTRHMMFLNCIEATLKGSRYVLAQSNKAHCATLVLVE